MISKEKKDKRYIQRIELAKKKLIEYKDEGAIIVVDKDTDNKDKDNNEKFILHFVCNLLDGKDLLNENVSDKMGAILTDELLDSTSSASLQILMERINDLQNTIDDEKDYKRQFKPNDLSKKLKEKLNEKNITLYYDNLYDKETIKNNELESDISRYISFITKSLDLIYNNCESMNDHIYSDCILINEEDYDKYDLMNKEIHDKIYPKYNKEEIEHQKRYVEAKFYLFSVEDENDFHHKPQESKVIVMIDEDNESKKPIFHLLCKNDIHDLSNKKAKIFVIESNKITANGGVYKVFGDKIEQILKEAKEKDLNILEKKAILECSDVECGNIEVNKKDCSLIKKFLIENRNVIYDFLKNNKTKEVFKTQRRRLTAKKQFDAFEIVLNDLHFDGLCIIVLDKENGKPVFHLFFEDGIDLDVLLKKKFKVIVSETDVITNQGGIYKATDYKLLDLLKNNNNINLFKKDIVLKYSSLGENKIEVNKKNDELFRIFLVNKLPSIFNFANESKDDFKSASRYSAADNRIKKAKLNKEYFDNTCIIVLDEENGKPVFHLFCKNNINSLSKENINVLVCESEEMKAKGGIKKVLNKLPLTVLWRARTLKDRNRSAYSDDVFKNEMVLKCSAYTDHEGKMLPSGDTALDGDKGNSKLCQDFLISDKARTAIFGFFESKISKKKMNNGVQISKDNQNKNSNNFGLNKK